MTIQEIQEDIHSMTVALTGSMESDKYLETWFAVAKEVHDDLIKRGELKDAALVNTVIETRRFLEMRFGNE